MDMDWIRAQLQVTGFSPNTGNGCGAVLIRLLTCVRYLDWCSLTFIRSARVGMVVRVY